MIKYLCVFFLLLAIACNQSKAKTQEAPITKTTKTNDTIQIVLLGFNEKNILPFIKSKIESYYHYPTVVIEKEIPKSLISPIRGRVDANKTIAFLKTQNRSQYRFVVGLTSKDICTPKNNIPDYGVFGLGSLDGSGCISSTLRLNRGVSQQKLIERLQKVVLHEIGHNHGINHCTSPFPCFMKDANGTIKTVDQEPMDMCEVCKRKMKH